MLTLTMELSCNGQGASDPGRYDFASLMAGTTFNVARHYAALATSYEITPLAKAAAYAVLNADDRSCVLWLRLEYSATGNFDLAAGVQLFVGGPQTEYGRLSHLLNGQVRWFS